MARSRVIRLLAVGALAGAEPVWRTLVNAIALDVYSIDAAVQIGGLGVSGDAERRWRALAAERLADGAIPLTTLGADVRCAPLQLPAGAPSVVAGSAGLRDVVERERPALAVCGGGAGGATRKMWLGDTMCLDPGSEAAAGALCGWVVDLVATGVMVARPLRT